MAEYIEREAALSLVRPDAPEDEKAAVTIATAKKLVRDIVRRTPAADVAPVVRCENCRYYCAGELHDLAGGECASWTYCDVLHTDMPPRAFCSYGKRKDGDSDA